MTTPLDLCRALERCREGRVQPGFDWVGLALPKDMRDRRCREGEIRLKYIWMSSKPKKKVHVLSESGRTLCKVENTSSKTASRLDKISDTFPTGKLECGVCRNLLGNGVLEKKESKRTDRGPVLGTEAFERWAKSREFLQSWEWSGTRYEVLRSRGAVCECCGASPKIGAVMMVDHIKPRSRYPELALDPNNLQVLCASCNRGKGNSDETDWRGNLDAEASEHISSILKETV